jgi:hypothetical protein
MEKTCAVAFAPRREPGLPLETPVSECKRLGGGVYPLAAVRQEDVEVTADRRALRHR